jgi:hypothetical protein
VLSLLASLFGAGKAVGQYPYRSEVPVPINPPEVPTTVRLEMAKQEIAALKNRIVDLGDMVTKDMLQMLFLMVGQNGLNQISQEMFTPPPKEPYFFLRNKLFAIIPTGRGFRLPAPVLMPAPFPPAEPVPAPIPGGPS